MKRVYNIISHLPASTLAYLQSEQKRLGERYILILSGLFLFRYFLISDKMLASNPNGYYDEHLYSRTAFHLINGDWLGPYDQVTLTKGFFYSLFMALSHALGIPLFTAELLLFTASILLLMRAMAPILNSKGLLILLYVLLLFHPFSTSVFTFHAIRDSFFSSLVLLLCASSFGFYSRIKMGAGPKSLAFWSILESISLFAISNTREESLVVLPAFLLFRVLSISILLKNTAGHRYKPFRKVTGGQHSWLWISLPLLVLFAGNLLVSSLNYHHYGAFIRNEQKESSLTKVLADLASIETDSLRLTYPITEAMLEKGFNASPTLATLRPYFEKEGKKWFQKSTAQDKQPFIRGGWIIWAIRDAAAQVGFHNSLPQSIAFYSQVSKELQTAFAEGRLKKSSIFYLNIFPIHPKAGRAAWKDLKESLTKIISFSIAGLPWYITRPFQPEPFQLFHEMTGERLPVVNVDLDKDPGSIAFHLKRKVLKAINLIYSKAFPLLLLLSIPATLIFLVDFMTSRVRSEGTIAFFWLGIVALYLFLSRIILIAVITSTMIGFKVYRYLDTAIPFMLLFVFLALFGAHSSLKKKGIQPLFSKTKRLFKPN